MSHRYLLKPNSRVKVLFLKVAYNKWSYCFCYLVQAEYCCAGVGELVQSRRAVSEGFSTTCWTATARGKIGRSSSAHLLLQHMQSSNSKLVMCRILHLRLTSQWVMWLSERQTPCVCSGDRIFATCFEICENWWLLQLFQTCGKVLKTVKQTIKTDKSWIFNLFHLCTSCVNCRAVMQREQY